MLKATGHSYQNGKCTVCGAVAAGDEDIQPPKTGDNSNMVLWIALIQTAFYKFKFFPNLTVGLLRSLYTDKYD